MSYPIDGIGPISRHSHDESEVPSTTTTIRVRAVLVVCPTSTIDSIDTPASEVASSKPVGFGRLGLTIGPIRTAPVAVNLHADTPQANCEVRIAEYVPASALARRA